MRRRGIRPCLTVLCLLLVFQQLPSVTLADGGTDYDGIYSAVLSAQTPTTKNCSVAMGSDPAVTIQTEGGTTGWVLETLPTSGGGYTINSAMLNINIADEMLYQLSGSNTMILSVTYWDSGSGRFSVGYDSQSVPHTYAGYVDLAANGGWKTENFVLKRPYFGNRLSGNDIRISVYSGYMSPKANKRVIISALSLQKGPEDPLDLIISSDNTGNIFYNTQQPKLTVTARNAGDVSEAFAITYQVQNRYTEDIVYTEDESIDIMSKNQYRKVISFSELPFGLYDVTVSSVSERGLTSTAHANFSVVYANYSDEYGRDEFGVATHMYSQYGSDGSAEMPSINRGGFGMVRESILWSEIETAPGVYEMSKRLARFLDNAKASRLEPLLILSLANKRLYPNLTHFVRDDEGVTQEEAEALFQEYLTVLYQFYYNTVLLLGDSVRYFEVGNEYNLVLTDSTFPQYGIKNDAADYARILEKAYEAIKAANPQAVVVGGVLSEMPEPNYYYKIPSEYVQELYDYGAGQWMDCLSVHFYKAANPGEAAYQASEELAVVKDIIDAYADVHGDKELWVTEYGWTESSIGRSEWTQGENLVKSQVLFAENGLPDKSFWYIFEGRLHSALSPAYSSYSMVESFSDSYGATHAPGAAKASYLTAATYNKLMKHCVFLEKNNEGNKQQYVFFDKENGTNVYVLWSLTGQETFLIPAAAGVDLTAADMFGNRSEVALSGENYVITAGTAPVYVMPKKEADAAALAKEAVNKIRFSGAVNADGETSITLCVLYPGKTEADFENNPLESAMYFNQILTDSEGRYDHTIRITGKPGTYTVLYRPEGETLKSLELTYYKTPFNAEYQLLQGDADVTNLAQFDPNNPFAILAQIQNGRRLKSDCIFITMFYKDKTLMDCKMVRDTIDEYEKTKILSSQEPLILPDGILVDEVRFIMIDSFNRLMPLASAKTILEQ